MINNASPTSYGYTIDRPAKGRRFAVGDIHGCFNTFESLVEDHLQLKKKDQLFLLGDYIDRGPRNREVLDYIMELIEDGYSVYPLMGNHEYFVLRAVDFCNRTSKPEQIRDHIQSPELLNAERRVDTRYFDFIRNLPYYYILDDFVLVHAGMDFDEVNPFADRQSMIFAREYEVDRFKIDHKILVHGHTPIGIDELQEGIKDRDSYGRINLDNGCVYFNDEKKINKGMGSLCALNLDTLELIACQNLDY